MIVYRQIATAKFYGNVRFLVAISVQNGRNDRRASTRTASPRFSATAFPNAHLNRYLVDDTDKFRVNAFGEIFAVFKLCTDFFYVFRVYLFAEYNGVGITDVDKR